MAKTMDKESVRDAAMQWAADVNFKVETGFARVPMRTVNLVTEMHETTPFRNKNEIKAAIIEANPAVLEELHKREDADRKAQAEASAAARAQRQASRPVTGPNTKGGVLT